MCSHSSSSYSSSSPACVTNTGCFCCGIESATACRAELDPTFQPNNFTVFCGKGKDCYNSIGNRRFRLTVQMNLKRYSQALTKAEKSIIVSDIVETIRAAGGQFVKQEKGIYIDVGDAAAREKVGALFRDMLHSQYRSSAKAKAARKRQQRQHQAPSRTHQDDDSTIATEISAGSEPMYSLLGDVDVSRARRASALVTEALLLQVDGDVSLDIYCI